jgi:predicted nucleic acid-binding protein
MRAVSNTSPISSLATIGRLAVLNSQFSEVWISAAVSQELSAHPDPLALAAIRAAISEAWIKPAPMPTSSLVGVLALHLHRGEAETIALAVDSRLK